jgi:class 3 adenylate cyclase
MAPSTGRRSPQAADEAPARAVTGGAAGRGVALDRLTLRFADASLEADFRAARFDDVIGSVRIAFLLAMAAWVIWGLILAQYTDEGSEPANIVRYGVMIPVLLIGLFVTLLPVAHRLWEAEVVAVNLFAAVVWTAHVSALEGVPFDLGYIGVVFILAFSFTLNRLRFVTLAGAGAAMIVLYFAVVLVSGGAEVRQSLLAFFALTSFYVLGLIASYTLERFTRLLFLRERQLDHERRRSEALLLNILPEAIAERLKERAEVGTGGLVAGHALADGHPEVAVVFADLAGFTEQAGRTAPEPLVATLDDLFSEMDGLADRYGLEKIKTVGDAYMAVAGVPVDVVDPAVRAVDMALDLVAALEGRRWPTGDVVQVRVGIALGPVVAGVIGRRKFAYDVWGDTVNLASRLQSASRPGGVLVAASVAERTGDRFVFGPLEEVELKGKGRQAVRYVTGRATT